MVDREGVLRNAAEHEFLYRTRRIVRVVGIEVLFGQNRDAAGLPSFDTRHGHFRSNQIRLASCVAFVDQTHAGAREPVIGNRADNTRGRAGRSFHSQETLIRQQRIE